MSYPPPPGSNSSLPPRPPPSRVSGFKPAFSPATAQSRSPAGPSPYSAPPSYPNASAGAPGYAAIPQAPGAQYGAAYQSYPQQQAGSASMSSASYQQGAASGSYQYPQQGYYGAQPDAGSSYAAAPQIRNPFPAPGQAPKNDDYDPDMAAQIAQWQSAYSRDPKDAAVNNTAVRPGAAPGPAGNAYGAYTADPAKPPEDSAAPADKKKTVVRQGGGQKWTDDTLLEWDPSHLRLFVGNLAGETTDESLYKAFSRWKSLSKARVIRDKVTTKSKAYGFVAFSDPDDYFQAAKEMNGKYIQSHPVVVRKANTEIKTSTVKEKNGGKWNNKNKNKNKNQNRSGNGNNGRREDNAEPKLGPHGAGVTKPGQKTKGGLKLLG